MLLEISKCIRMLLGLCFLQLCLDTRQKVWCFSLLLLLDNLNTILIWISALLTAALCLPSVRGPGGKFTHISDTKPMLDGQCYWMLAHKLCVFRSTHSLTISLARCACVGVGVLNTPLNCYATTTRTTYVRQWPLARQIPFDVQSAERQRQWSMQKVFQTFQARFDFGFSLFFFGSSSRSAEILAL